MSAPKFTPGPWAVDAPYIRSNGGEATVCEVKDGWYRVSGPQYSRAEVEANARLIAAAPELYGALEELANAADESLSCDHNELCPFAQRLRDAVIKARAELAKAVQP